MLVSILAVSCMTLFCLKLLWNLSVPYVGLIRVSRGASGHDTSISLMPVLEVVFLTGWVTFAAIGIGGRWVFDWRSVSVVGISAIVLSYLHMVVVGFVGGLLCSHFRRKKS